MIETKVPISQIVESPNLKTVVLKQSGEIVTESEKLLEGTVRGTVTHIGGKN